MSGWRWNPEPGMVELMMWLALFFAVFMAIMGMTGCAAVQAEEETLCPFHAENPDKSIYLHYLWQYCADGDAAACELANKYQEYLSEHEH